MRSLKKTKWKKALTTMIVAFSILAFLKPVQASVGSYGRFDSVEVFSKSDEASNVNYNDAGYFEGKVPRVHSDVDHVLIRGNYTFEAKYRDTIEVRNYFYASYHYYIAAGLGHAIIQTFYYIYEKETGLLSGPWEIFRDGGYHTSIWDPQNEGQDANWQFRTSWAWTFELIEGFTYTLMYFFKVSATVGSYVEQYGCDTLNNKGAFIDFSGLKSLGYLQLWYEANNELFKEIGGYPDTPNNQPNTPSTAGPTSGWTDYSYIYYTSTIDPDEDDVRYQFDWGDGSITTTCWYASGATANASHTWDSPGTYYIWTRAQDVDGAWSGWSYLEVSITTWVGGGGCPYVSTWDGSKYLLDNNLIPAAEHSNGTDVIDYYRLQQPLIRDEGKYSLLISEVDKHSYIDKVQLLAVDHDQAFNIAVTPSGEILTYGNSTPPQTAITKDDYDVTNLVERIDDDLYYEGWPDDYLTVDFGDLDITKGAKLLVRADPLCEPLPCKLSIHVQVLKSDGWTDVATFIPRTYWSTDIVDLSAHLPDIEGELKVRLYFTGNHKIDYIGLDTSEQEEFEVRYANLASASHSIQGDVKETLMNSDDQYAELLPSEQVILKFTLPQNTEDTRDFIIITEGHYYPIQT